MTKAQLQSDYDKLALIHNTFRQEVVTEALRMQKIHNLCGVVDRTLVRLGLAELMPHRFVVQRKVSARARWSNKPYGDSYDTAEKAFREAKLSRDSEVADARWQWQSDNNIKSRYFEARVTKENADDQLKRLNKIVQTVKEADAKRPPFVVPAYPIFRVMEIDGTGKPVGVVEGK